MPRWEPYKVLLEKKCKGCQFILPIALFKGREYKNGHIHYEARCKDCNKVYFTDLWHKKLKQRQVEIPDLKGEEWKDISEFEGYYRVSNLGRIKSLSREVIHSNRMPQKINEKLLRFSKKNGGYFCVTLVKDKESYYKAVHRLVAEAFIPNPENKPTVNHKNGVKSDNRASELEWATRSEQTIHAYDMGLLKKAKGEDAANSKLLRVETPNGKTLIIKGGKEASRQLGIPISNIYRVLQGRGCSTKTGYKFQYI